MNEETGTTQDVISILDMALQTIASLETIEPKTVQRETTGFLCSCGRFHFPGKRRDHRAEFVTHQNMTEKRKRQVKVETIVPVFPYADEVKR